jgi:flagellar M-ring protein FliF
MNPLLRFLQLPARQLIGLAIAIAAVVSLISGAWMWGQTPDYRVLYSNLSDRDGGAVVQALSQMNIAYKFTDGGGAILCLNQVYDTRLKLASQGCLKGAQLASNHGAASLAPPSFRNKSTISAGQAGESVQSLASVQTHACILRFPNPPYSYVNSKNPVLRCWLLSMPEKL